MVFREVCKECDIGDRGVACVTVEGKRVVLIRVEEHVFAMSGVCSHEQAYLDEGMLDGYVLYCPLHYSAFDVRSGKVLAPPADRDLECFPVKVHEGGVYIDIDREDSYSESGNEFNGAHYRIDNDKLSGTSEQLPRPDRLLLLLENSREVARATDIVGGWTRKVRQWLELSRVGRLGLDVLHGRVGFGHPLHPAATDVPVGFWLAASVADSWDGEEQLAMLLRAVGLAGALVAIGSGIADWSVCDGRDRRIGFIHGSANVVAFGLQCVALLARAKQRQTLALAAGYASLGLVLSSAYIGGHLVFGRGLMVNRTAWLLGPLDWVKAIRLEELESRRCVGVAVEGRKIILLWNEGTPVALDGTCSHAGASLVCSEDDPGVVECPLHGSQFRVLDGRPLRGPATFFQPTLEVRVTEGWVEVRARR